MDASLPTGRTTLPATDGTVQAVGDGGSLRVVRRKAIEDDMDSRNGDGRESPMPATTHSLVCSGQNKGAAKRAFEMTQQAGGIGADVTT